jgi:hypothetical protein
MEKTPENNSSLMQKGYYRPYSFNADVFFGLWWRSKHSRFTVTQVSLMLSNKLVRVVR